MRAACSILPMVCACSAGLVALSAAPARAQMAGGASLVRRLGARAAAAFARPGSNQIGALVTLPAGTAASDLGLSPAAPGLAHLFGPPAAIAAFGERHPELAVEVSPPLHTLLDTATRYVLSTQANAAGYDGSGALVGIADTGIDVTHPDFLDAQGHTRVAWLIDFSQAPKGLHADLESKYATMTMTGAYGAVWAAADIDQALAAGMASALPQDEVGHGTMVASCAAGSGAPFGGVAPKATLVIARISAAGSDAIDDNDLLNGVAFLFDRAGAMGLPIVVNLSLGSDFGPHDGTTSWEQALASYVGPSSAGRAIVVAAGNSGSIAESPVHDNVYVSSGSKVSVPVITQGAQSGGVQVWVAMHAGTTLKVGLDGPDGTWIPPVAANASAGKNTTAYDAAIYNGSAPANSPVPSQSNGAAVVWQGKWPSGTYAITLSGEGTADLYAEGTGDAALTAGFANGVREGTINLPATSAPLISVGCTINKATWTNLYGSTLRLSVPTLDSAGGEPSADGGRRDAVPGEPCWFSSVGPTLTGLAKPEIMAPGAAIIGAMSGQAVPPSSASIFTNFSCPIGQDACQTVDSLHAASFGTSFSSPIVAGAVALLFQRDPALTQDKILAVLQGGAHALRGPSEFADQAGAGELDVVGALAALDRLENPALALPDKGASWLALGADQYLADGSTPLEGVLELRSSTQGGARAAPADGFDASRLAAYALVDGEPYPGAVQSITRRGPGVWVASFGPPGGLGGSSLTVGATFDGVDIVAPRTIPIATDAWNAAYAPSVGAGCDVAGARGRGSNGGALLGLAVAAIRSRRRGGMLRERGRGHRREADRRNP